MSKQNALARTPQDFAELAARARDELSFKPSDWGTGTRIVLRTAAEVFEALSSSGSTVPTIEQCTADPNLAAAVRELAAKLERQDWLSNSQTNNEIYVAQLEDALALAEKQRGPSRLLGRGVDAHYLAADAAVTWLRDRLAVVSSALIEQRGSLAGTSEIG